MATDATSGTAKVWLGSAAFCVAVLSGLASPVDGQAGVQVAGCYRVEHVGEGLTYFQPPAVFRLDPTREERHDGIARPLVSGPSEIGYGYWSRIAGDSLRVSWGNGFAGPVLTFQLSGDAFSGSASSFGDFVDGTPRPRYALRGTRIDCSSAQRTAGAAYPDSIGLWATLLAEARRQESLIRQVNAEPIDALGRAYTVPLVQEALGTFAQQFGAESVDAAASLPPCPSANDIRSGTGYQLRVHEPDWPEGYWRTSRTLRMYVLVEWWCRSGAAPADVRAIWQRVLLRHLETGWVTEPGNWVGR